MIKEDKAFSSIDFVGQCLVDEKRVLSFQKAINKTIKKHDIVLDLGTGFGIMTLLAARAGAKKIFTIELDSFVAKIAKRVIGINNLGRKVKLLVNDVRNYRFPQKIKFNVVISEMLTTGMIDESQVQAINNLHEKKLIDSSTTFLPFRHDTYISLVNANFKMFGLKIPIILHLWKWHKWKNLKISKITNKLVLNSIYFNKKNKEKFERIVFFEVEKTGIINSLYLASRTFLTDKIFLDDTEALNAPMLVPISEKFVKRGQKIKLKISYMFGAGYKKFKIQFIG